MAEIHKLTKSGKTIYPATVTNAVVHPELRTSLTSLINEYNVSNLYPTGGTDGSNKYTLNTAILLLDSKLNTEEKKIGTKIGFINQESNYVQYIFTGTTFTDTTNWEKFDSNSISNLNKNVGLDEYETFSEAKEYPAGYTLLKDGLLYTFITDHAAGAWNPEEVEDGSIKKEVEEKINNSAFLPFFLYKKQYRISSKTKADKIRKVVLDMYVKLSEDDNKRYQVTQIVTKETGKSVNIYTESSTGKFDAFVCSFKNENQQNFFNKTLDNETIIYIYIDWDNLTETITVNEDGAYSDDAIYTRHAGYIDNALNKEQQDSINAAFTSQLTSLQETNEIRNIDSNKYFVFTDAIDLEKILICNSIFQDVLVNKANDVISVGLMYILYDKTISEQKYTSINIREYISDETTKDTIINASIGKGIELIEYTTNKGTNIKMLIDWDIFNSKTEQQYNYYGIKLMDTYYKEHYGLIYLLEKNKQLSDYSIYDQMYIWNGKAICNNNNKNSKNVVAKYAQVEMKSNVSEAKIRFIATKTFTTTLVVTNLKTKENVENITKGSIHICFHRNYVAFGLYVDFNWDYQRVDYDNLNIGQEYIAGIELLGSNQIKILLPDNTEQTFTIGNLDNYIGNRFIFEHYFTNTDSIVTNNVDGYSPFTGVYCRGEQSDDILRDNFKRANGSLGVAPTGQVYTLFHNTSDEGRTEFDN